MGTQLHLIEEKRKLQSIVLIVCYIYKHENTSIDSDHFCHYAIFCA